MNENNINFLKEVDIKISENENLKITFDDVKKIICPIAEDKEIYLFLLQCKLLKLNPFLNEIYLLKYEEKDKDFKSFNPPKYYPAQIILSYYVYLKKAHGSLDFNGVKNGWLYDEKNQVIGAWAEVYRKNIEFPFRSEVFTKEYNTYKSIWKSKPLTMINKVALEQAYRFAYPDLLANTYCAEELGYNEEEIKNVEINKFQGINGTDVLIVNGKAKEVEKNDDKIIPINSYKSKLNQDDELIKVNKETDKKNIETSIESDSLFETEPPKESENQEIPKKPESKQIKKEQWHKDLWKAFAHINTKYFKNYLFENYQVTSSTELTEDQCKGLIINSKDIIEYLGTSKEAK